MEGNYSPMAVIGNDFSAEQALIHLRETRAEYDRRIKVCKDMVLFYQAKAADLINRCANECAPAESQLSAYFETVPHKVTKTQESYALPSGKLMMKQRPPQFSQDDGALAAWLIQSGNESLVETIQKPKWGALKKMGVDVMEDGHCVLKETGEIIDGVTASIPAPVFQVVLSDKP